MSQPQRSNYAQILDGFSYGNIAGVRPFQGSSYYWQALANLIPLRLAAADYRPRDWMVPKSFTNDQNANEANIAPGKTALFQIQVKPGSYLWGLSFASNVATIDERPAADHFSLMVRESQTEIPLFDRPVCAAAIRAAIASDEFNTLTPPVFLLAEPRLILDPGVLDCEVSNDADPDNDEAAVSAQFALFFAEPKRR